MLRDVIMPPLGPILYCFMTSLYLLCLGYQCLQDKVFHKLLDQDKQHRVLTSLYEGGH